jgi:uncharacterized protein
MKYILFVVTFAFVFSSKAQDITTDSVKENPNYDSELAQKYEADDYGMKSYVLVILKSGSNTTGNKQAIADAFRGHLNNIGKLVEEGKLIIAGPMDKNENNYRGIFILNVESKEEAVLLLQSDPAINANYLDVDIYTWYGSAALPSYLDVSDRLWKKKP